MVCVMELRLLKNNYVVKLKVLASENLLVMINQQPMDELCKEIRVMLSTVIHYRMHKKYWTTFATLID